MQIPMAETTFGVTPVSRVTVARWIARSPPPSGSCGPVRRKGAAYARATTRAGSANSTASPAVR
jgi:hypothetical protein